MLTATRGQTDIPAGMSRSGPGFAGRCRRSSGMINSGKVIVYAVLGDSWR
jgi:hypothetical protein